MVHRLANQLEPLQYPTNRETVEFSKFTDTEPNNMYARISQVLSGMSDMERQEIEHITARSLISSQIYRQVKDKLENTGWKTIRSCTSSHSTTLRHLTRRWRPSIISQQPLTSTTHIRRSSWCSSCS